MGTVKVRVAVPNATGHEMRAPTLPVPASVTVTSPPSVSVPEPAIVEADVVPQINVKPLTVKGAEMVNVEGVAFPKVSDIRAWAGATDNVGCEPENAVTPIETLSFVPDPGFPFGDQFVVVAHVELVVPIHL